jgi:hypothetical protein
VSQSPKRRPAAKGSTSARKPAAGAAAAASAPGKVTAAAAGTAKPAEPAESAESAGPPPLRLSLAAGVAGVEGLAVVLWGVGVCFAGSAKDVAAGLLVLCLAALPLAAAYGLRKARRWSRGPALIMQLLCLPIAWTMLHSDGTAVALGAVLGALAVAGLVLLVSPSTTDALGIRRL